MSCKIILFVLIGFVIGIMAGTGLGSSIALYNIPCDSTTMDCQLYDLLSKYIFGGSLGLILVVVVGLICIYKCCC